MTSNRAGLRAMKLGASGEAHTDGVSGDIR